MTESELLHYIALVREDCVDRLKRARAKHLEKPSLVFDEKHVQMLRHTANFVDYCGQILRVYNYVA